MMVAAVIDCLLIITTLFKNKGDRVTATIIGTSLSFASLASSLPVWHSVAFSSLQKECTLSLSVVFDPNAQRLI